MSVYSERFEGRGSRIAEEDRVDVFDHVTGDLKEAPLVFDRGLGRAWRRLFHRDLQRGSTRDRTALDVALDAQVTQDKQCRGRR